MDWYEPHKLAESIRIIRRFLIDVASMDHEISYLGLYVVRGFDNFGIAINAMEEFPEKFTSLKRKVSLLDKELFSQLEFIENDSKLVEQLSLINLKIQMSQRSRYAAFSGSPFAKAVLAFPRLFIRPKANGIFGNESVSIERAIVNCEKLISTLKVIEEVVRYCEEADDTLFKPSNIKESRVVELIDQAIEQIENLSNLSSDVTEKLIGYLQEAKNEVASSSPKWSKVVGALVIAAALTSGLADAPGAAKTLQSAIEYILGSSISKQLHHYLPPPPPVHIETVAQPENGVEV